MSTSGTKISKRVEKELHQRKVIIRRLPPDFTEEKLREKIDPFPDHVYFYFCPGDPTLGNLGFSRAYIAFEREEDILPFRNSYDGMLLEGGKAGKYRAIVEFAPYQGVPKKPKRKMDVRCGTIDKDPDYQAFMQSLESRPEPRPSVQLESYLEELAASRVMDVQVTPLIEFLKDRMSGRGGRSRGRGMDAKKKRKGESASGRSKGYKSSKSGSSGSSGSKSRDSSSKGKKEKDSESASRSGSSTKLTGEEGGESKSGATQRASSGRQDRKEKYRGSEKKEGEQDGAEGEEKESRRNKGRNRDRPDRSIYVPRSRNAGGGGGGGEKESRDSSKEYHGRGGRGRQGRHDDSGDYGGRPRSRGRGRGYRRNSGQPQESGY